MTEEQEAEIRSETEWDFPQESGVVRALLDALDATRAALAAAVEERDRLDGEVTRLSRRASEVGEWEWSRHYDEVAGWTVTGNLRDESAIVTWEVVNGFIAVSCFDGFDQIDPDDLLAMFHGRELLLAAILTPTPEAR